MRRDLRQQQDLRRRLDELVGAPGPEPGEQVVDAVVTTNEMNERHGTGSLVRRVFAGHAGILSIRARDDYGGEHDFGEASLVLHHGDGRARAFGRVLSAVGARAVRRALCIPLVADDLLTSIALKELYGATLGVWIMDDQNVAVNRIPDALMAEFLSKCSLRLATHPQLREAYQAKYRMPFWLLPAVVPHELISTELRVPSGPRFEMRTGAMCGSFWSKRWFELTCRALAGTGYETDWYGNHRSPYFRFRPAELARARVRAHGIVPEPELVAQLREYGYAIVPSGTLRAGVDDAAATARLSLPGRILFAAATTHTPSLVLGSRETSAARFVERFDVGLVSDYEPDAVRRAIDELCRPETQLRMRRNAAALAPVLSAARIGDWLLRSLESGRPADDRFERLWGGVAEERNLEARAAP